MATPDTPQNDKPAGADEAGGGHLTGRATDAAHAAAGQARNVGAAALGAATMVATAPIVVAKDVAADIAGAVRQPDTVAYWAGLAALTVAGVLELPVAAAVGVGVAIAKGGRWGSRPAVAAGTGAAAA
ncbi:MAG: hypothetical protein JWN35_3586 [Frankiales bacterium]|jgi:hypothetical protein|nr:hypothetical protein [Frankiales bacterium]